MSALPAYVVDDTDTTTFDAQTHHLTGEARPAFLVRFAQETLLGPDTRTDFLLVGFSVAATPKPEPEPEPYLYTGLDSDPNTTPDKEIEYQRIYQLRRPRPLNRIQPDQVRPGYDPTQRFGRLETVCKKLNACQGESDDRDDTNLSDHFVTAHDDTFYNLFTGGTSVTYQRSDGSHHTGTIFDISDQVPPPPADYQEADGFNVPTRVVFVESDDPNDQHDFYVVRLEDIVDVGVSVDGIQYRISNRVPKSHELMTCDM